MHIEVLYRKMPTGKRVNEKKIKLIIFILLVLLNIWNANFFFSKYLQNNIML